MVKKSSKKVESILQNIHNDYGKLPQEFDPKKVVDTLRRLADGVEKGEVQTLAFTYGFTSAAGEFPHAIVDFDFVEHKLIEARREEKAE